MGKILIVTTSHTSIPGTDDATGVWYEELAAPYCAFADAGYQVALASIRGGEVPIDARSLAETPLPEPVRRFHDDPAAIEAAHHSKPATSVDPGDFEAIFLPGGHGTMWDFPNNPVLATLIATMLDAGKIVASVCHGPAGFIGVTRLDGSPLIKGRSITCFSDSEERAVHLDDKVPFLLETTLRGLGAQVSVGPDFTPHIMEDGNLLTGQNPKSSEPLAQAVITALKAKQTKAA
ncbi:type 1 glutamine amidotransferase domain-containing protein [Acidiphilium iwatense]|uniref:Type 1 glutamine amidotransferase domain-containing protein n=1 Tax=Acidiphilium iwatense TaxID=768198 RepID=A0ABS9DVF7_9PROT|nr:type 1 glutamine amidotransferase domain-containing protein [Acidiphilium iwatense]MCF3946725.1 type 1 glutamine amidotransferase domain-containing protein [Acidiphilium iwatense]